MEKDRLRPEMVLFSFKLEPSQNVAVFHLKDLNMPKALEDLVTKLMSQSDFYPEKEEGERRSLAYAIATKQLKEKNDAKASELGFEFIASDSDEATFSMIRASDGKASMLLFKNAVLARAERNKNHDEITPEGIAELAATIAGRPIDYEHKADQIRGMFTAGRVKGNALLVDGAVWADRYPTDAQMILDGTAGLSIEAKADKARCSVCAGEFESATNYCEHLSARRKGGAVRTLTGLKARGGAITKTPAGTNTRFDASQIYLTANHQEACDEEDMPSEGEKMKDKEMDDEEKSKMDEMKKKHMESESHKSEMKSQEEKDMEELEKVKAELEAALAKITTLESDVKVKDEKITQLEAKVTEADAKASELKASLRRNALGNAFTDDEWKEKKDGIVAMSDDVFDLMASKLTAKHAPEKPTKIDLAVGQENTGLDKLTLK